MKARHGAACLALGKGPLLREARHRSSHEADQEHGMRPVAIEVTRRSVQSLPLAPASRACPGVGGGIAGVVPSHSGALSRPRERFVSGPAIAAPVRLEARRCRGWSALDT